MATGRVKLDWHEEEWRRLFYTRGGAAGAHMEHVGQLGEATAKELCPVSEDGHHGRPAGYLRDHITHRVGFDAEGPYVDVISEAKTPDGVDIGLLIEFGTAPHPIDSHGDYPLRDAKGNVFGRHVDHPGTAPNPFLRRSVEMMRGRL